MIFDRGGGKLAENLPNGLKVSGELFHVGFFWPCSPPPALRTGMSMRIT